MIIADDPWEQAANPDLERVAVAILREEISDTINLSRDPALDALFSKAKKHIEWYADHADPYEAGKDWFVVEHPDYPECVGRLVIWGSGVGSTLVHASALVPVEAVVQMERYLRSIPATRFKRRGGPKPTPLEERIKIVMEWREKKGEVLQQEFAAQKGLSSRQLRRWEKELVESGHLEDDL